MPDKKPLNILIIDDDEEDYFIIGEHLRSINNGHLFSIDWCGKYEEATRLVCSGKYDLYFVDFRLGAQTGLDLIKHAIEVNCEEPIILLTGMGNQEIDIMAMQAGAVDYLVKSDLNPEKLERSIRYARGRYEFLKALKANEQKFRMFFEKSKDSVFMADDNLVFKEVNEGTTLLTEYSRDELYQMSLFDLLVSKEDQKYIVKELADKGAVTDKEIMLFSKNREKIDCILTVSREKNGQGEFYIQGIVHNITLLKKSEKAFLQTEKLNAAQRLLLTLAHEVRNPLTNIYLSLDQLRPNVIAEGPQNLVEIISRNSKRISSLITQLLDTSKPVDIDLQKISLNKIVEESVAAALDRVTLKNIALQVNYHDTDALVMADIAQLKIAFLNIIINAIEAMDENYGKLLIEVRNRGARYVVTITDNGNGISEADISKLFEPYFTSKPKGMGLGLASTLNIIQSHKAVVDVASTINEGTTFSITFEPAE